MGTQSTEKKRGDGAAVTLHRATITRSAAELAQLRAEGWSEAEVAEVAGPFHFGSLDGGESFIELDREPTIEDAERIATLCTGDVTLLRKAGESIDLLLPVTHPGADSRPVRLMRRWLQQRGAEFAEVTP